MGFLQRRRMNKEIDSVLELVPRIISSGMVTDAARTNLVQFLAGVLENTAGRQDLIPAVTDDLPYARVALERARTDEASATTLTALTVAITQVRGQPDMTAVIAFQSAASLGRLIVSDERDAALLQVIERLQSDSPPGYQPRY